MVFLLNLGTIFQYKISRNVHFLPSAILSRSAMSVGDGDRREENSALILSFSSWLVSSWTGVPFMNKFPSSFFTLLW